MKHILRRIAVLAVIFVLGVAGTAFLLNSETTDDRSDMNDPVLPELMVDINGTYANRMYGYRQEMQVDFVRDCITPLNTTKEITFVIDPYEAKVDSLAYEIRTSDGSKVLENRRINNLTENDSYLTAKVKIESDLLMSQEYSMQITLDTDSGDVHYYTRVVSRAQTNTEQYVKFVQYFYETCMNKSAANNLASYLEPEENQRATNYANINIHSSLSEVSFGSLAPTIIKRGIPVIKEINETTASISLEYQISSRDSQGNTECYDVTEFYRMRYMESRIRLLDFERSVSRIFDPSLPVITDEGLNLGIRDRQVSYMTNEEGSVIAFVQAGDLWSYSPDNGKIVKVFSFRKGENGDFRDSRRAHDIQIIRVEEDGDVDFVLYGYMNRGNHEGYCGLSVYHYSNDQNAVAERVFIPSTESYEFLKKDLGTLSYVSKDNQLFLLFADKLYQIDIEEGNYKVLEEGIDGDDFVVSRTNAHAAWLTAEGENAGKIKLIDFDTLATRFIAPEDGQQLRTLGFMNEDLIYGILLEGDRITDENGHEIEGIHTLRIENFQGEMKKEYHQEGLYITDISVGENMAEFDLSSKKGKGYVFRKKDTIMNNNQTPADQITIELVSAERTGVQVRLALEDAPATEDPLVIEAKIRSVEEHIISLDARGPAEDTYYVYAAGSLYDTFTDPAKAVSCADEQLGVVLNRWQQYVWERGNRQTSMQLNLEDIPEIVRTGNWNVQQLAEGLGEDFMVLDLSGCTLDSVLYEISAQRAVIAKTGANASAVIVGYDEYNTYLYNPDTGEVKPYGMNDSTALFEKAGNIFISYMETLEH